MAHYMIQATYASEAWAALIKSPADRSVVARATIEALGGRLETFYYGFGEYDLVAIVELPDDVSAAAGAIALAGSGGFKATKTTVLMTVQEGIEAMRKVQAANYSPPR